MNIQELKDTITNFVIKPFATDFVKFGPWTVSANACGYFLTTDSGYRFRFNEDQVDDIFEVVTGIESGSLKYVSYSSGSSALRIDGGMTRLNIRASTANQFFAKALDKLKLDVVKAGNRQTMFSTDFAAVVAA